MPRGQRERPIATADRPADVAELVRTRLEPRGELLPQADGQEERRSTRRNCRAAQPPVSRMEDRAVCSADYQSGDASGWADSGERRTTRPRRPRMTASMPTSNAPIPTPEEP